MTVGTIQKYRVEKAMLNASIFTETVVLRPFVSWLAASAVLRQDTPIVRRKKICAAVTGSDFVARSAASAFAVKFISALSALYWLVVQLAFLHYHQYKVKRKFHLWLTALFLGYLLPPYPYPIRHMWQWLGSVLSNASASPRVLESLNAANARPRTPQPTLCWSNPLSCQWGHPKDGKQQRFQPKIQAVA